MIASNLTEEIIYIPSADYAVCAKSADFLLPKIKKGAIPMPKKKLPQTIEECNAELERTQKLLQQYENRNKMLNRGSVKIYAQKDLQAPAE